MPSITREELKNRVYGRLENNTDFYTEEEVEDAIHDAIVVLNLFTGFIQTTVTVLTQARRPIYDVPSGLLLPIRVRFEGRALEKVSVSNLGSTRSRWLKDTSTTTSVPVANWVPIGISKIAIYPADAYGGGILEMTGVADPTRMTADTDVIQYGDEYASILEEYAAHVCMFKNGGLVSRQSMHLYMGFLSKMKELKRYKAKLAPQFFVAEVDSPK